VARTSEKEEGSLRGQHKKGGRQLNVMTPQETAKEPFLQHREGGRGRDANSELTISRGGKKFWAEHNREREKPKRKWSRLDREHNRHNGTRRE